jgi:Ferric reductase like transmembrane component/Ferric reductase NAD binding domain/FAD-binding domain
MNSSTSTQLTQTNSGTPFSHAANISSNSTEVPYYTGLHGVNISRDRELTKGLGLSIMVVLVIVFGFRAWELFTSHIRHIYCLTANRAQQNYWSFDRTTVWPSLKKHLIYAPIGKKRHNREIQLSNAHNYGTLPGRLHSILLLAYFLSNVVFCLLLDYKHQPTGKILAELRGRSGILATANIIALVIMAGRNNPLIGMLKISFDTFNLFHRWIGRIVVFESTIHVLSWFCAYNLAEGADAAARSFAGSRFLQYGLISMVAFALMLLHSLSPIRHAFYEVFLHVHQVFAFCGLLGLYQHLELPQLPALPYIRAALFMWLIERVTRVLRILYLNRTRKEGNTSVVAEALPGEATRLTFQLPRHITIRPGSHVYVMLPKIALWQSHPFSVAWTNIESEPPTGRATEGPHVLPGTPNSLEKQKSARTYKASEAPTSISLIVAARAGMTRKLYNQALNADAGFLKMSAYVEGPYAGHEKFDSYGTVFMFAGGAGITHHLIQVRYLLSGAHAKTVATRKITLVWTVRDSAQFSWVRPWMDEIMVMPGRREMLQILLYVTKPRNEADFESPHGTIRIFAGRCDPGAVLDDELPGRVGATMVSVCGPGAFADEVRAATRARMGTCCIDFNEEAFTW